MWSSAVNSLGSWLSLKEYLLNFWMQVTFYWQNGHFNLQTRLPSRSLDFFIILEMHSMQTDVCPHSSKTASFWLQIQMLHMSFSRSGMSSFTSLLAWSALSGIGCRIFEEFVSAWLLWRILILPGFNATRPFKSPATVASAGFLPNRALEIWSFFFSSFCSKLEGGQITFFSPSW